MGESTPFRFKHFVVAHDRCGMKVNTDGMLLGALADAREASRILDIGTGSGYIALMMAQQSKARVTGIEIEENAFQQAQANFRQSPWPERLEAVHLDFRQYAQTTSELFDVIISNPPFFQHPKGYPNQPRATARFNDVLPFSDLLAGVGRLLTPEGRFYVIIPHDEEAIFMPHAHQHRLYLQQKTEIITTPNKPPARSVLVFGRNLVKDPEINQLKIQETNGAYSLAYRKLTADYYDHLL